MTSSTGDFTDLRRSTVRIDMDNTDQKSRSAVKRRVPRKLANITPLNMNEIRKEVEQEDKEKLIIEKNCVNEIEEMPNNLSTPLKELHVTRTTKENDSFDLNFSALPLVTPVKKLEPPFVTSKVLSKVMVPFEDFVTPSIDRVQFNKIQYSASKTACSSSRKPLKLATPSLEEINEECLFNKENYFKTNTSSSTDSDPLNKLYPEMFIFERLKVQNMEYLVLNPIGKGGSSEVFACFCPEDKRHVAIKCVSLQNPLNAAGYINEVKLLQKLQNCDKIIKMYDYEILETEKKLLVVLERGGQDLSTILKNIAAQKSHIPFYMLFFYWMEMLYAVKQIHSHGVIHSDLKPANFLKADSGLKLIDFGIASTVQVDMTSVFKTNPEGSCNYISPEALNQEHSANVSSPNCGQAKYKLHYKSDVWSLGCILYQLVYRRTPFHHLHTLWKKLAYIMNPNHVIEFPEVDWVPPKIIETIKKCLQYDVKSRPYVDELISEYESFWCNHCFTS